MEQFNLNTIPGKVAPVCHASQYDVGRIIRVNLFEGDQVYTLDGTEVVSISVRKPDGHVVTEGITNTSAAYVEIITTEQMTACPGANLCELKIEKGADVLGTLNFILSVEEDPLAGGDQSESFVYNLAVQIAQGVAQEVANQYDSANVIFDNAPTSGHGVGYAVTSEGVKTEVDTLNTTLAGKVDQTDFYADNLPVSSGDPTDTKTYIDGRTPIKKGGHATDLSTTGLTTGTYLYNYDNTTNGIPKANTEGDCYITINNTQSYGCELAVSNSGLFWRAKNNQVWGNWEDIIGKLTSHTAQSTGVVAVSGTFQIPADVLNHNIIIVSLRRQGKGGSNAFLKSELLSFDVELGAVVSPSGYYKYRVSTSGLITLNDIVGLAEPFITVTGIL